MWTAPNKKYFDVIRAEESKRRYKMNKGSPSVTTSGATANSFAATGGAKTAAAAMTGTMGASASRSGKRAPPAPIPARDVTLEERSKLLDPFSSLHLERKDSKHITEMAFDCRGLTGLHENMLYFENLATLSLQRNKLKVLHNLLPRAVTPFADEDGLEASTVHGPCGPQKDVGGYFATATTSSGVRSPAAAPSLQQLTGPRGCFRLRRLLLSGNRLRELDPAHCDVPRLSSLEYLNLSHNRIGDLSALMRALRPLKCLVYLDLAGNPVCEESGYRQTVIVQLPQLQILDRVAITETERREAKAAVASAGKTSSKDEECHPTTVAFGSTLNLGTSQQTSDKAGRPQALWSKSTCVQLMEKRYKAHLKHVAAAEAARVQAEEREAQQAIEVRQGFHATWELSRQGMPLSATKMAAGVNGGTAAAATAASAAEGGNTSGNGANNSSAAKPPVAGTSAGAASSGSRKRRSTASGGHAAPAAAGSLPAVGKPASADSASRMAASQEVDFNHQSVMYDALLGRADVAKRKELRAVGRTGADITAPVGAPPPVRLAEMSSAITEANALVKLLAGQQSQAELAGKESARGGNAGNVPNASRRVVDGKATRAMNVENSGREAPPAAHTVASDKDTPLMATTLSGASTGQHGAAAAAALPALIDSLKTRSHAFIPPPWEGAEGGLAALVASSSLSPAAVVNASRAATPPALLVAERLDAILSAVATVFLPQELQSLETCFGPCELIAAVRTHLGDTEGGSGGASGGFVAALSSPTGATGSGTAAGNRLASGAANGGGSGGGKRPASQASRKPGRNATAQVAAAAEAENAREALWAAITTASTTAQVTGAPPTPALTSSSASSSSAAAAAAAAAAAGSSLYHTVSINQCVVGAFTAASVSAFLNELSQRSEAWGLETAPLLASLLVTYGVDPTTGKLTVSLGGAGGAGACGSGEGGGGVAKTDGPAVGGAIGRGGQGPRGGKSTASRSFRKAAGTAAAGSDGVTLTGDATGAVGEGGHRAAANQSRKLSVHPVPSARRPPGTAPLTVNHLLVALAFYEPFLQQRIAYFGACCAEATTTAIRSGAVSTSVVNPRTARPFTSAAAAPHRSGSLSSEDEDVGIDKPGAEDGHATATTATATATTAATSTAAATNETEGLGAGSRPSGSAAKAAGAKEKESYAWFARLQKTKVLLEHAKRASQNQQ